MKITADSLTGALVADVLEHSGENVSSCFQCGKCSSGCPMVEAMDVLPHQIMRYVQLGLKDDLIESRSIWICASCFTCASRCPRDLDLSKIAEGLRASVMKEKGGNRMKPESLPLEMLKDAPQQALISGFRKYTR